jgi:predicted nuclease of predicted toxin-antitoxin system
LFHKIIADECVDFRIVRTLRVAGFEVISILEESPSVSDRKVLEFAKARQGIVLTEDSDFGRWIFAHKFKNVGVIFLRYTAADIEKITRSLLLVLQTYQDRLARKFVVIKVNKLRIRDI